MYKIRDWRHNYDGCAIIFCEMDTGVITRFTGCTAMASDYSRYRVVGDIASVEAGQNIGGDDVRLFYFPHTKPEGEEMCQRIHADLASFGERGERAAKAGHGGGDYWIVQNMLDYFLDGKEPFFDVYKGAAMSATAILAWRSCLNHGQNYKVPDFRDAAEREMVRDDDLTPFPDENGNGATLPAALPWDEPEE